jgi:hypothetical protein
MVTLHDIPEVAETTHRGTQTLKENTSSEAQRGSASTQPCARRAVEERASRPAVQRVPQTREVFHTDLMIKQEIRRSGMDANHRVPESVTSNVERHRETDGGSARYPRGCGEKN